MTSVMAVGWDGSAASAAALDWAVRTAVPDGEVLLVRVVRSGAAAHGVPVDPADVEGHDAVDPADVEGRAVVEDAAALEDAAAAVQRTHPGLRVRTAVERGDPVERLRSHTGSSSILVVGTDVPGPLGVKRGWSVGARLAASAFGPVVMVPRPSAGPHARADGVDSPVRTEASAGTDAEQDEGLAADDSGLTRAGVVVGVDGTEEAYAAAMFAAEFAKRRGEALTVVHVWREPEVWENAFVFDEDFVGSLEAHHDAVLREVASAVEEFHPGLPVTRSLLRGAAAWALLDAARDAALLVVGCRGHRGVKRMFLGSVSHAIVLNLVGPTVVIPHGRVDAAPPPDASPEGG